MDRDSDDVGIPVVCEVRELGSGDAVADAAVAVVGAPGVWRSDDSGRVTLRAPPGAVHFRVRRLGYLALDTLVMVRDSLQHVTFALRLEPIRLRPLTVEAERRSTEGGAAERALFRREVVPGVIGVGRRELREIPALAEPDVLRSLQALPGVVALNDLSAQLNVRGGGPDQNLFLLDGARIFAPYHMFGMFGAFNPDAVERVEFFRGAVPARMGGALSSVVAVEQRTGADDGLDADAGVGMLAARATLRGGMPWLDGRWMLAARRSHADLVYEPLTGESFPYAFYDVQGRASIAPAPDHRLRASFFASSDRFRMFLGSNRSDDLAATWRNGAGSLHWTWNGGGRWTLSSTGWGSLYHGTLVAGRGPDRRSADSRVEVLGLRIEAARRGERSGIRVGLDAEGGRVGLTGSDQPDGYFLGQSRGSYAMATLYAEAEHWLGPFRLAPGLRAGYEADGRRRLLEPRLAARVHLSEDVTVSAGAGRTTQLLSSLRDDRYVLPGAPMWFLHDREAPASIADGIDLAVNGWKGRSWSVHASAFARRFRDVPRWRPVGTRSLEQIAFDDGEAAGIELMLRRHEGRLTGWLGYGLTRVRLEERDGGAHYAPTWDRRHAVDLALFWNAGGRLSASARVMYAGGQPFWPIVGRLYVARLYPTRLGGNVESPVWRDGSVPIWSKEQRRMAAVFRVDLGVRYRFHIGPVEVTPYASVLNVTGRHNALYYTLRLIPLRDLQHGFEGIEDYEYQIAPVEPLPFTIFPSLGFDVRF